MTPGLKKEMDYSILSAALVKLQQPAAELSTVGALEKLNPVERVDFPRTNY